MIASDMKFGHYYVVDVAFRDTNPIHRAIAFNAVGGGEILWLLRGGYAESYHIHAIPVSRDKLAYFAVIEEITAMQQDSYKLPCEGNEP